jgi:hypothetical protein
MGFEFPNFEHTKLKHQLHADIIVMYNCIETVLKRTQDKKNLIYYRDALSATPQTRPSLPHYGRRKGTRALEGNKTLCIYALLNALIASWYEFIEDRAHAGRCYELITELNEISKHGLDNHELLGNLQEGFYLYRR